jgi:ABC-type sugar transport system substrate-binding protein
MGGDRTVTRKVIGTIGVIASVTALAACGGSSDSGSGGSGGGGEASGSKSHTIYLNQYSQEIQYFRDKYDGVMATAKERGWKVDSEYGNGTPEQQIQQVQNALTKHPDAIVVTPIDQKSLEPVLRQAKAQNIPVFTVGGNVATEDLYVSFIATSNLDLGKQKAQYVVDQLKGQGTVGIVHGIRGLTFSEDQSKGYLEVLKQSPGIKVVDGGYAGGFSSDLGLQRTQNMFTANPKLDAIIFDNDDLALGGIQAAEQRKIPADQILMIGTDGGGAALKAVEKGDLDMTVSLCGFAQGIQILDVVGNYLDKKEDPGKLVVSKTDAFTPENYPELSKRPRSACA